MHSMATTASRHANGSDCFGRGPFHSYSAAPVLLPTHLMAPRGDTKGMFSFRRGLLRSRSALRPDEVLLGKAILRTTWHLGR
ncbi:MAG: hypothetical protein KatS3mg111_2588 [Pirellulaceae bacterium]|nr:MAG: hypothetical protein KatS3mg111_2588 [Pirellulaceae bacterium]